MVVGMQVVVGHLETDAPREPALLLQDLLQGRNRVFGLASAPAPDILGQ